MYSIACNTSHSGKSTTGFIPMFNGKDLDGWKGDPTYWRVEDGNLVGEVTPSTLLKTNSFIIWQGQAPADFELTVDFRVSKSGNSGINYRSELIKEVPNALRGYQADIDGAGRYTGQNYEERGRTTLAYVGQIVTIPTRTDSLKSLIRSNAWSAAVVTGTLGNTDSLKSHVKKEDWNTYRLVVKGNRLQHYVNDILMSDVTDEDTINGKSNGLLGVQVHVGPPMKIEYRNFRLRDQKGKGDKGK
jgi:hypothetical protein